MSNEGERQTIEQKCGDIARAVGTGSCCAPSTCECDPTSDSVFTMCEADGVAGAFLPEAEPAYGACCDSSCCAA